VFSKRVPKLKQCTNLILHDENDTPFVVSLLVHKMDGGRGGGAYFKFRPIGGAFIPGGGGGGGWGDANSKIYGILTPSHKKATFLDGFNVG